MERPDDVQRQFPAGDDGIGADAVVVEKIAAQQCGGGVVGMDGAQNVAHRRSHQHLQKMRLPRKMVVNRQRNAEHRLSAQDALAHRRRRRGVQENHPLLDRQRRRFEPPAQQSVNHQRRIALRIIVD